jgi:penicillin amidase
VPAIYFEECWNTLYPMIWDEMQGQKATLVLPSEYTTIKLIKDKPDLSFFDQAQTPEKETVRDLIRKSFSLSVRKVGDWKREHPEKVFRWADYKDTYVQHLLQLPAFSYHAVNGGNSGIVNASSHRWGPSWRMVVSLEKTGVRAWGVYPGGQSGNPGSPFYNNLLDAWSKGEYYRLRFTPTADPLRATALSTTLLKPLPK